MRFFQCGLLTLAIFGCATNQKKVESLRYATEQNDGDLPSSGIYNNDQNESLAVTVKTLESEIFEQKQKINHLEEEVQVEKLKNQKLKDEESVLKAREHIRQSRSAASTKIIGWTPNGDPIFKQKTEDAE